MPRILVEFDTMHDAEVALAAVAAQNKEASRAKMEDIAELSEPTVTRSEEDLRAAMKKLSRTKGLPTLKDLMASSGYRAAKDVPESDYAIFIAKCEEA